MGENSYSCMFHEIFNEFFATNMIFVTLLLTNFYISDIKIFVCLEIVPFLVFQILPQCLKWGRMLRRWETSHGTSLLCSSTGNTENNVINLQIKTLTGSTTQLCYNLGLCVNLTA